MVLSQLLLLEIAEEARSLVNAHLLIRLSLAGTHLLGLLFHFRSHDIKSNLFLLNDNLLHLL